ncbi:hypothetical protein ACOSP7_009059 [Xanthoceras sorbifolium]
MLKLGFPNNWISLMMDCVSTSRLSFVINGNVIGDVRSTRGIRQGCPLSPYLFLLCVEAFSALIHGSEQDGNILGFRCCRGSPLVSHLFFADDSINFCRASVASCEAIKSVLQVYEKGSGQQINLQKSCITFSPNVDFHIRKDIQQALG